MTSKFLKNTLLVCASIVLLSGVTTAQPSIDLPKDWFKAGDKPTSYEMGIAKGAGQDGKNCAIIKSIDKKIDGFGTLMQQCLPEKYLGKRVRMTGYLKSKEVSDWAGFWLRIDQPGPDKGSALFDNMHDGKTDRSIKGTTEWKKYEIVLDVPLNATNMGYGALVAGTGQIWFENLNFEIVDNSVPTTGKENQRSNLKEPSNLNFEK